MDISGKLSLHLPTQSGEGKNGPWQKSGFVIEISNERFPKKICFTTWGDIISQAQSYNAGDDVKVFFDIESREYQGKWYSDIKAWKIEKHSDGGGENPAYAKKSQEPASTVSEPKTDMNFTVSQEDDLPF